MKNWDKAKALELYRAGATDEEIATEVGMHRQTVRRWRTENGLPKNPDAEQAPPAAAPEPPTEPGPMPEPEAVKDPDGSGPGPCPDGPVELHLELCGGWARIRAPGWVQAAKLWRMMDVCISALRMEGGEPPERKEG